MNNYLNPKVIAFFVMGGLETKLEKIKYICVVMFLKELCKVDISFKMM